MKARDSKLYWVRLMIDRGRAWLSMFMIPITSATFLKVFGVPDVWILIAGLAIMGGMGLLGYLDFAKGIWRGEARVSTGKINPYFEEWFLKIEKQIKERKE